MKEDIELKLNLANRHYDTIPVEQRDAKRRVELAALENTPAGLGLGDAFNFALGAGTAGYLTHMGMQYLPKKIITEPQLQEKVQELFSQAMAATKAGVPEGVVQDGMQALKKHGINPNAKPIKALGSLTEELTTSNAQKIGNAKAYIQKTIQEASPYVHDVANHIQKTFPGGMTGLAVTASVVAGLAWMTHKMDISDRYRDARISNLKQDLTHAEMLEMRRTMEQMATEKQR
jgi:hypothetical protein